jgi:hypothetical protein
MKSCGPGRSAGMIAVMLVVVIVIAACGKSATQDYFDAADPIFEQHSTRNMAKAESAMFLVASMSAKPTIFDLSPDVSTATEFSTIFRETALAIQKDIADWDRLSNAGIPEETAEYHALIREVMSLRLGAMTGGSDVLDEITSGGGNGELSDAENAMLEANDVLKSALSEADQSRE